MADFKREERYRVVKLKDISEEERDALYDFLQSWHIPTRECVVVEPDWPNYEQTWRDIEAVTKGEFQDREQLETALEAANDIATDLRLILDQIGEIVNIPEEPHQGRDFIIMEAVRKIKEQYERGTHVIGEREQKIDALEAHINRFKNLILSDRFCDEKCQEELSWLATKGDPVNSLDVFAEETAKAAVNRRLRQVKNYARSSDQTVTLTFSSCRAASEFENETMQTVFAERSDDTEVF